MFTRHSVASLRARNLKLLEKYLGGEDIGWWTEAAEEAGWFAVDFVFQTPWTPEGLPGATGLTGADRREFFRWLDASVTRFRETWQHIYEGDDPDTFWVEYYGEGESSWGTGGHYEQLGARYVRLDEQGRMLRLVQYNDPSRFLKACGFMVPTFDYNTDRLRNGLEPHDLPPETIQDYVAGRSARDAADEASVDLEAMSDPEVGGIRERNCQLLRHYLDGQMGFATWMFPSAVEAGCRSDDFIVEFPNFGHGWPRTFPRADAQRTLDYLNRTVMRFTVTERYLYSLTDPYAFWIEYYGDGAATWGQGGPYRQLELVFVRLDQSGHLKRFREYFDSSLYLETAGAWGLPTSTTTLTGRLTACRPAALVTPPRAVRAASERRDEPWGSVARRTPMSARRMVDRATHAAMAHKFSGTSRSRMSHEVLQ